MSRFDRTHMTSYYRSVHSNYGPILYHFPHIGRKCKIYIPHVYSTPRGGGRSLRISQRCSVAGKLEWWGYHADSSLIIAVSTQYRNVTDGWTDRQNYHYQYRALALLLWRRKQSHIKLECCVQTAQTSAKTKIPAKSHPGFESGFSGLIHIRIPMSAGSLPKCCGLSASVISWKSTGDCVKNANKSPQIPSSAMVGWGGEE